MKYKHIITAFLFVMPLCVIMRILQVMFMTNQNTGFFAVRYRDIALLFFVLWFVALVVIVITSTFVRRCPTKMPKIKLPLALASIFYGGTLLLSAVVENILSTNRNILTATTGVVGIVSAGAVIVYGLSGVFKIKLNGVFLAIPVLYYVMRLVCIFMVITTISITAQNILWVLCECAQLLFALEFAKTASGVDKNSYKKMLPAGLGTVTAALSYSLPNLLLSLPYNMANNTFSRTVICSSILAFGSAIFAAAFTFMYYGYRNLKVRSRHHKTKYYTENIGRDDTYYLGGDGRHSHQ